MSERPTGWVSTGIDDRIYNPKHVARFWSLVEPFTGLNACWQWRGNTTTNGYGRMSMNSGPGNHRRYVAHRVAYTLLCGPIPDDLTLDHLCRNPACVNPDHLEVVTIRENILRRADFRRTPDRNIRVLPGGGYRWRVMVNRQTYSGTERTLREAQRRRDEVLGAA